MVPILVLKTHLSCGFLLTVDFLGLRRSGSWPHFSDQPQDLGEQSPRHRNLSHLESNVPSVRDDPGADLDQLILQAGQRPVLDRLRQSQRPHEVSEIVSKRMKLKTNRVVLEFTARQPGPHNPVIACWPFLPVRG